MPNTAVIVSLESLKESLIRALTAAVELAFEDLGRSGAATPSAPKARRGRKSTKKRAKRAPRTAKAIARWVPDRRARRVPNFVIDQTGLKTKKAIVAKYGDKVVFLVGKAPPKA